MADDAAKDTDAAVNAWSRRQGQLEKLAERADAAPEGSAKQERLDSRFDRKFGRQTGAGSPAQAGRDAKIDRSVSTIAKAISPKAQAAQATKPVQPRRVIRVPEGKTYAWQQHTGWSTPKKS